MKKKKSFLVLPSGKFLEALGSGIRTGSIFCLSFSLSNRVSRMPTLSSWRSSISLHKVAEKKGISFLKSWHFEASEGIMTKFKSTALHIMRIKHAGGSGSPPCGT